MNKMVIYAFSNQHSHPRSKLKYETHMRCLQLIRNKYEPKSDLRKERVRSRAISKSSEISDDQSVAKKKTKRSVENDEVLEIEDPQSIATGQNNFDQLSSSTNGAIIDMDDEVEVPFDVIFDYELQSSMHGNGDMVNNVSYSHSINSTEIPTVIQIENVANDLREIGTSDENLKLFRISNLNSIFSFSNG